MPCAPQKDKRCLPAETAGLACAVPPWPEGQPSARGPARQAQHQHRNGWKTRWRRPVAAEGTQRERGREEGLTRSGTRCQGLRRVRAVGRLTHPVRLGRAPQAAGSVASVPLDMPGVTQLRDPPRQPALRLCSSPGCTAAPSAELAHCAGRLPWLWWPPRPFVLSASSRQPNGSLQRRSSPRRTAAPCAGLARRPGRCPWPWWPRCPSAPSASCQRPCLGQPVPATHSSPHHTAAQSAGLARCSGRHPWLWWPPRPSAPSASCQWPSPSEPAAPRSNHPHRAGQSACPGPLRANCP
mmetsp:Transcript_145212/g.404697  ORF Transcript_145212/g.404697 Transcript_145212/m.404697 type:complete len:296 (-) Transcript_145212:445-1332(-)